MAQYLFGVLFTSLVSLSAFAGDPAAEALINRGHWKRARVLIEQRYQAKPNDPESCYLLSRVQEAFGELGPALQLAEKAVALDGRNANYHLQLAQVCGETAEKASFFSKAGWAKRFKEEAEKAAALDPKNLDARFALLEYYLQAPRLMGGGKDKAAAMADEIGRINLTRGYLAQVRLAQDTKDPAKEEVLFMEALASSPHDYDVLVSLANYYGPESRKKYDVAEKYAREALQVETGRVDAYSSLARLYAVQRRWTDLEAILAEAEGNVPDDLNPCYQAGRDLLLQGSDLPRAERYFRKYLSQKPEANAPSLAHAHWRLGLVLERQGRKSEALSEIQTAVRMKPDLEEAKKDLKGLK